MKSFVAEQQGCDVTHLLQFFYQRKALSQLTVGGRRQGNQLGFLHCVQYTTDVVDKKGSNETIGVLCCLKELLMSLPQIQQSLV